jgi:hypothetical protein
MVFVFNYPYCDFISVFFQEPKSKAIGPVTRPTPQRFMIRALKTKPIGKIVGSFETQGAVPIIAPVFVKL